MKKESIKTVSVDKRRGYAEFNHDFKIPFKECKEYYDQTKPKNVLDSFKDVIIDALIKRMDSCIDMVSRHIQDYKDIICSNEYQVIFKKENGAIHCFNHPSFQAMSDAIDLLNTGNYSHLNKMHFDQILKALYWVDKPEDKNGISFGNLISYLSEMIIG